MKAFKVTKNLTSFAEITEISEIAEVRQSQKRHIKSSITRGSKWLVTDSWALEYAGLTISIATMGSIYATLGIFNGRPLSDWTYSIMLGSILSILATVLKGSILLPVCACLSQLKWSWYHHSTQKLDDFELFDAASRGPLGAALLLYRLRFWHLASIGSIVTLLALASDAFTQQSLRYPERPVHSIATIPIAQSYGEKSYSVVDGDSEVDRSFIPALYNGILAKDISQSSSAMSVSCPTGNCTFPPYASIAMCSACTEVTSLLNSSKAERFESSVVYLGSKKVHFLPNGLQTWDVDASFTVLNISTVNDLNTDELLSYQPRLFNISAIWGEYHETPHTHRAFDCVFYFCVQTFSGAVTQNDFTELVQDVHHDPSMEPIDTIGNKLNLNLTVPQGQLPFGTDLNFNIGTTVSRLNEYVTQKLIGASGIGITGRSRWNNDVVHGISQHGASNFTTTMANLATAMTNTMRTISGDTATGTASKKVAYIHVRWAWLLLPLVMIILASVLLGLTVWQSHRYRVPKWRSSALAVMEHGVRRGEELRRNDDLAIRGGGDLERNSELEAWAREVKVSLRRGGRDGMDVDLADELRGSRGGSMF
jgi:Protein of unknown function (DUF3176)